MRRTTAVRCFVGATAAASFSMTTQWMQPVLIRYFVVERGMGEAAAGLLLTVELIAIALVSGVIAHYFVRKYVRAMALAGAIVSVVASLATLFVSGYWTLIILRVIVGIGAGATSIISNVVAANFRDPDKTYAQMTFGNLAFGSLIVAAYAPLREVMPAASPYAVLFVATAVLAVLTAVVPRLEEFDRFDAEPLPQDATHALRGTPRVRTVLLSTVGVIVLVSSGIAWSLYGLIGRQSGLPDAAVDSAIALSISSSAVGLILPAVVGTTLTRVAPFCVGIVLMAASIVTLMSHPAEMAFRVAVCVNVASLYFVTPYLLGAAASVDGGGKAAAYIGSTIFFGNAVSPLLAGMLISRFNTEIIGWLVVGLFAVAAGLFIHADRLGKPRESGALPGQDGAPLRKENAVGSGLR